MRTKFPVVAACDDVEEVLAAELVREPEPERGRLDADVRVERLLVDRGEDVAVRLRDRARLLLARDLLAEDVDRRHLPAGVEVADDGDRLGERRAGDVARGEALDDRLRYRRAGDERWRNRAATRPPRF